MRAGRETRLDGSIAEPLSADDPREIGPFTLIGLLGSGGMGEVFLGATTDAGYVAVKRVRPRLVTSERFKREVGILYRVPAGVAPSVLASDAASARPWFATEYVPGLTVDEAVRLLGPLPADTLWLLLAEIAAHLHSVHEVGIVHRDLKPANVMLVHNGVKLIDFGIALATDQARLTRSGGSYGTRGFTAPEQEAGDLNVASPADVWALGALLVYAASGRTPGVVPDTAALRAVDADLAEVVEACLAEDPAARPPAVALVERARMQLPAEDLTWPERPTERIEVRRTFAATPTGKMQTIPPPERRPPAEITEAGTRAISQFLRARLRSAAPQWTSKLMVVGEGAVGKSSLVKALTGLPHDPSEETTHGMRVSDLALAHPDQREITMSLAVRDFGGQEIYHAIHQFFLTSHSLFVLVANALTNIDANRLNYWLETITARAPDAPIVLVATHTAHRPADIDAAGLRARYPMIVEHLSVDNATGQGIDDLRGILASQAAALPIMGTQWPAAWTKADNALASTSQAPYCSNAEMRRIMASAGVEDAEEQQALAAALSHRGQLVHYPENPELADTVVLQPQWLSGQIARLLDHPGPAARSGVLAEADLEQAWPDLERETRRFLLALMHRFELTYPVERDDSAIAIVVNWLPVSPQDYAGQWDAALSTPGCRELRIRYLMATVMPPGIPSWFLARSHRFVTSTRWRTGALLRHPDGHLALIHADPVRGTIDLAVRGPLPALFFAILDDGLNLTLDRYPGLGISRQIHCPGHGGEPCVKLFDYSKLRNLQDRGRGYAYCDEAEENVDLDTLLLGITPTVRELSKVGVTRLLSGEDARTSDQPEFLKITTMLQKSQQAHCPSIFTLTETRRRLRGTSRYALRLSRRQLSVKSHYTLRLYCEEPGSWHPLPGDEGCYEITELAGWLRSIAPFLQHALQLLKAATPIAGPILGIAANELHGQVQRDIVRTQQLLKNNPGHLAALDVSMKPAAAGAGSDPRERADTDSDFRVLRKLLESLDPDTAWGGLSHVLTPEGHSLYLCREHLAAYRQA